jgi:hypothetical protein
LNDGYEVAAIERRDEPDWRLAKLVEAEAQDGGIGDEHEGGEANHPPCEPSVAGSNRLEANVESSEQEVQGKPPNWRSAMLVRL